MCPGRGGEENPSRSDFLPKLLRKLRENQRETLMNRPHAFSFSSILTAEKRKEGTDGDKGRQKTRRLGPKLDWEIG